jgi:phytoene synthase
VEPEVRSAIDNNNRLENEAAARLVKSRDPERYWSALFAPPQLRPDLVALYAFNAELTHIPAAIKEPMVGQIRLQWWRDAIELAAPGTKTGNPVADALAAVILKHNLPKEQLIGLVDSRSPVISAEPPADIQALRQSFQAADGTVFELAAAILGDRSETATKAAGFAGLAYGLTHTLRTVPLQLARQALLLPPSYFESRGINLAALYRGKANAAFGAALADLRGAANRALQQFRALAPELSPDTWPAFLLLTLVKPYLKAMAAPSFDPMHTVVTLNPARRFWRIWRAARRETL